MMTKTDNPTVDFKSDMDEEQFQKFTEFLVWLKNDKLRKQTGFGIGDEVKLPFDEKGEIVEYVDVPWSQRFNVRITESNGFNEIGEVADFFVRDLELIKK